MQRILVALDASKRAPVVLSAATKLAAQTGAKLILFRAIGVPPEFPREVLNVTDLRLEEILLQNAREDLTRLARDVSPERIEKVSTSFAVGWDGICHAARTENVDLIMLGSHGYEGLDRLLGTTASKVVNHADRNVLVVRTGL